MKSNDETIKDSNELPLEILLERLDELVSKSLSLWDISSDSKFTRINVSENVTYLIEAGNGEKSILRVHRENYHTERAIECELEWMAELEKSKSVRTSGYYAGRNGRVIQKASIPSLPNPRFMVLFEFIDGVQPDEDGDLVANFEELGEIAAKLHNHSIGWEKSKSLERLTWDLNTVYGENATWGNWRDAPYVTAEIKEVLERVELHVKKRLTDYGKSIDRFGLIHADMRLANLLVESENTRVIDFDDCGYGWYMYEFAASISFIEDDPRIPEMKESWLIGYKRERQLKVEDENEINTFIMLRRMALLAWIGSHIEAPEPQALADGFADTTADLGLKFIRGS